jgi:hypothetical protein
VLRWLERPHFDEYHNDGVRRRPAWVRLSLLLVFFLPPLPFFDGVGADFVLSSSSFLVRRHADLSTPCLRCARLSLCVVLVVQSLTFFPLLSLLPSRRLLQFQERFGIQLADGSYTISAPWQAGLSNGAKVGEIIGSSFLSLFPIVASKLTVFLS